MQLYDLPPSPNARRVRIFVAEKGLEIPLVPVDMASGENQKDEYLAKNSLGKMPVLELDDGTCIAESAAICRYLEELNPNPPLMGSNALERAQVEMWNRRIELEIYVYLSGILRNSAKFFKDSVYQVPEYANACRKTLADRFVWLNDVIGDRTYLMGDTFTVADITGCTAFKMLGQTKVDIAPELVNLQRWVDTISARPSASA